MCDGARRWCCLRFRLRPFRARRALSWPWPFTLGAPTAASIVHPVTSLRTAVVGAKRILCAGTGGSRAHADPSYGLP